ncbi:MAG: MinD/ParA family protein [Haloarculaceae archaeon]
MGETLSLVGAAGGAGTTRLTVEVGATLARAGRSVALLDAAYATQGLAQYVPGRVDPDVTALATGEGPVESGLVDLPVETPGRLAACPALAPFERLARAKTPAAARRLEALASEAAASFDYVLVDTPPVAANQAVAAVTATDRVALVTPASERGADALGVLQDRLADLGAAGDVLLVNGTRGPSPVPDADVPIPRSEVTTPSNSPACLDPDPTFAPAVAAAAEAALDCSLDLDFPEEGGLDGYLPGPLGR